MLHAMLRAAVAKLYGLLGALSFDGTNQYVDCGDIGSPSNNGWQLTVEARVRFNSLTGHQTIFCDGGFARGYEFGIYNGELHAGVENNDFHRSLGYPISNLVMGTNYSLAARFDGVNGSLSILVDGIEVARDDTLSAFTDYDGSNGTTIGSALTQSPSDNSQLNIGDTNIDGLIAEMRVWEGIRTDQEIQDNMLIRLTGNEAGLYALWPLNESSGTTASNLAGTTDGTLQNSPTWAPSEVV